MTQFQLWACRYIPGVHPGIESLISRADGRQSRELDAHLARCRRCRLNAERLCAAVVAGREDKQACHNGANAVLNEIFGNLQLQMRAWCSLGGRTRQQHWINALEFYFGKEIARQAGDCGVPPATKPLFHVFLGRKAAEAVARQIASAAM